MLSYNMIRPLLFLLPEDQSHAAAKWFFSKTHLWEFLSAGQQFSYDDSRLQTSIAGLRLGNPICLAAGYDKDSDMILTAQSLGFGLVTVGSIRPALHPGNPKPWEKRLTKERALVSINGGGLPSRGVEYSARKLEKAAGALKVPVMASIVGTTVQEYLAVEDRIVPLVDGIEVNVSCPNDQLVQSHGTSWDFLQELLKEVRRRTPKPIAIKLPPYERDSDLTKMLSMCLDAKIDIVTASNSNGITGRPMFEQTCKTVERIRRFSGEDLEISAVGGVFSASDAFTLLKRGANAVGLVTALIFEGPSVAKQIKDGLVRLLLSQGFASVAELTSYSNP